MQIKNLRIFLLSITTAMTLAVGGCSSKSIISQGENEITNKIEGEVEDESVLNYEDIHNLQIESISAEDENDQPTYQATIIKGISDKTTIELTDLKEAKEFIQKCSNLETLHLIMEYPGEIGILKNIPNSKQLESLYLYYDDIEVNLDTIDNFQHLKSLYISGEVTELSFLENLSHLQSLELKEANVENIDIVGNMTELEKLTINNSSITTVDIAENMTNLTRLNLYNNANLTDITAIEKLKKLEYLSIGRTSITDFGVLKSLPKLRSLDASNIALSNIDFLEYLPNLRLLYLDNTGIENIEKIAGCKNLKYLSLSYNQISDISVLIENDFPDLEEVHIEYNNIPENQIQELQIDGTVKAEGNTKDSNNDIYNVTIQKKETEEDKYILSTINYSRRSQKETSEKSLEELTEWLKSQNGVAILRCYNINGGEELQILDSIQSPKNFKYLEIRTSTKGIIEHLSRFSNLEYLIISTPIENIDFLNDMQQLKVLMLPANPDISVELVEIVQERNIKYVNLFEPEIEENKVEEENIENSSELGRIEKSLVKRC